jgi:hypothetical protein
VAYRNPRWILAQTWQERGIRWKSGTRPCGTRNNKQTNKWAKDKAIGLKTYVGKVSWLKISLRFWTKVGQD